MIDEILKPGKLVGPGKRLIMLGGQLGLKQKQLPEGLVLYSGYLSDIEDRDKEKKINLIEGDNP